MLAMPTTEVQVCRGLPVDALQAATRAVEAFREGGDLAGLASALRTLASAHLQKRSSHQAASAAEESSSIFRELGDRAAEVESLLQLAVAHLEAGSQQDASAAAKRAQELCKTISDSRGHNISRELLQVTEHFDKEFRSGLWVPGKGMAAKIASGIGGEEVRKHKWFPQVQPEVVSASQKQEEQQIRDRRFGQAVPFQRKPFPWNTKQPNVQSDEKNSEEVKEEKKENQEPKKFSWSDAMPTPLERGSVDGWQCGQCGMIFTDPEDGELNLAQKEPWN
ncbi:unnamed protein product [Durusdinium trenchii]|uniref:Uncharacterized protein n=1 Tax=Durusdinium trenchii TaxID=1381693 RepID=A0ABP0SLI1_9DINO